MEMDHQLAEDPEDAALVHDLSELDRLQGLIRVTVPSISSKGQTLGWEQGRDRQPQTEDLGNAGCSLSSEAPGIKRSGFASQIGVLYRNLPRSG